MRLLLGGVWLTTMIGILVNDIALVKGWTTHNYFHHDGPLGRVDGYTALAGIALGIVFVILDIVDERKKKGLIG